MKLLGQGGGVRRRPPAPDAPTVEVRFGGDAVSVGTGDAALVRSDERVSLRNPGDAEVELLVAAGPPAFVASIRAWPAPGGD